MNGFRFTTETGSVYEINRDAMTWRRVSRTDKSGEIRNEGGTLVDFETVRIGEPAFLQDTNVRPGHVAHFVETSRVVAISEIIT